MSARSRLGLTGALLAAGLAWGIGVPFWKIAASTGHGTVALTAGQLALTALILGPVLLLRGTTLPLTPPALLFYAGLSAFGSLLPNIFYYIAIARLPAGIMALTIATVPMFSLLIATLLGLDRPRPLRLLGVLLGFAAMALLAAPDSLPAPGLLPFLLCGLLTAFFYGCEGNFVTLRAVPGLDPFAAVFGASLVGLVVMLPLGAATGDLASLLGPPGPAEAALAFGSALNCLAYGLYVWLVGRAGPVFAAQSGYVVTLTGVFASLIVLGERYPGPVWLALSLVLGGLALVTPKPRPAVP